MFSPSRASLLQEKVEALTMTCATLAASDSAHRDRVKDLFEQVGAVRARAEEQRALAAALAKELVSGPDGDERLARASAVAGARVGGVAAAAALLRAAADGEGTPVAARTAPPGVARNDRPSPAQAVPGGEAGDAAGGPGAVAAGTDASGPAGTTCEQLRAGLEAHAEGSQSTADDVDVEAEARVEAALARERAAVAEAVARERMVAAEAVAAAVAEAVARERAEAAAVAEAVTRERMAAVVDSRRVASPSPPSACSPSTVAAMKEAERAAVEVGLVLQAVHQARHALDDALREAAGAAMQAETVQAQNARVGAAQAAGAADSDAHDAFPPGAEHAPAGGGLASGASGALEERLAKTQAQLAAAAARVEELETRLGEADAEAVRLQGEWRVETAQGSICCAVLSAELQRAETNGCEPAGGAVAEAVAAAEAVAEVESAFAAERASYELALASERESRAAALAEAEAACGARLEALRLQHEAALQKKGAAMQALWERQTTVLRDKDEVCRVDGGRVRVWPEPARAITRGVPGAG